MKKFIIDNSIGAMLFIGFMAALMLFKYGGLPKDEILLKSLIGTFVLAPPALIGKKFLDKSFHKPDVYSFYESFLLCESNRTRFLAAVTYGIHFFCTFFCGVFVCSAFMKA